MDSTQLDSVLVGKVIAQFRQKRGLTQDVVSGLADLGRSHLSAIERGERKPTLETFFRISTAMDYKASEILAEIECRMRNHMK